LCDLTAPLEIWDILLAERGKRTVILTTHFLDEAEFLADHMVIMHEGELKAQGSVSELKNKLGEGYRVHTLPSVQSGAELDEKRTAKETIEEDVEVLPNPAAAIEAIKALEQQGKTHYQITGPTIEEVFMKLAAQPDIGDVSGHSANFYEHKKIPVSVSVTDVKDEGYVTPTNRQHTSALRQTIILFMKRVSVLRRNPVPSISALLIPVIAAGFVSLLTKGAQNPGCRLIDQVAISDSQNLTKSVKPLITVGPSSALSPSSLDLVFKGFPNTTAQILGAGNGSFLQAVHLTNSLNDFNAFTTQQQKNITPGGLWLGDESSPATFNYRADIAVGGGDTGIIGVYNSILVQNVLNVLLSNTSISTTYAVFDFPWPATTSDNIQFVFYFGLVMAVYPAFFSLYPTRERLKNVRALQYSNGVRPFPLWLAYLLFDFIIVIFVSALITIIFAATSLAAWYFLGYVFVILLLYGIASILLSYVLSVYSKSQLAAFAFSAGGQA
jgi:ATP-binding cassette subfamily A (ABC1) protein 3